MKAIGVVCAGLTALAVLGGAEAANAQQARVRGAPAPPTQSAGPSTEAVSGAQPNQITPATHRSSLRWDALRGRWGLQLDLDQPAQRDPQWRDWQAGPTYNVTRSLRVGALVGVTAPDELATRGANTSPTSPRVRLETAFRF